jgi:tRNA pseudouridine38-40 synthase
MSVGILMMRYALCIEYDGSNYSGFQRQHQQDLPTIQEKLEQAISKIAHHPIKLVTAGRTDAGVHAINQVIHFDTTSHREPFNWILGINTCLPQDIAVKAIRLVPDDFHARFSAKARCYEYRILNRTARSALLAHKITHYFYTKLDEKKMQQAANCFLGEHDFSSFRAKECQAKSPIRRVDEISVIREGDNIIISIQANAFLHHMVRNIAGVLLDIGSGKKPINYAKEILEAKNRMLSSPTAKACGLYLTKIIYPEQYELLF